MFCRTYTDPIIIEAQTSRRHGGYMHVKSVSIHSYQTNFVLLSHFPQKITSFFNTSEVCSRSR